LSEKAAIAAAWAWFRRHRDRDDIPFAAIVARVRARAPGTSVECIKSEFGRRLRRALQRGVWGGRLDRRACERCQDCACGWSTFVTVTADPGRPVAVGISRLLSSRARARSDKLASSANTGRNASARASASA